MTRTEDNFQTWKLNRRDKISEKAMTNLTPSEQSFLELDMRKEGFEKYDFNKYLYFCMFKKRCPKYLEKYL